MTDGLQNDRTTSARDFGLLILRIAVGAAILQAGLLKFSDFGATVKFMETDGWRAPTFAALLVSSSETIGGLALLLGLLTPLAACAVIAAMIDAWAVTVATTAFWSNPFNVPFMIGFGAIALLFTGAGVWSLDQRFWGRAQWPGLVASVLFVLAVAAAVVTWVMLNGTNPIHLTSPG